MTTKKELEVKERVAIGRESLLLTRSGVDLEEKEYKWKQMEKVHCDWAVV